MVRSQLWLEIAKRLITTVLRVIINNYWRDLDYSGYHKNESNNYFLIL